MRILLAGSSGFIGSRLFEALQRAGHMVDSLVRPESKKRGIPWDPSKGIIDPSLLEDYDAVISLCGASIADKRWTEGRKRILFDSRIQPTRLLANTFSQLKKPPKVVLFASAIGYYGHVPKGKVTEKSPAGQGFLANLTQKWEQAAAPLQNSNTRVVFLRTGIVLGEEGALAKMKIPFQLGFGGVIGSGQQGMSWIDIDDEVRAILFCLDHSEIQGAVNLTAPNPVSNAVFIKTLGKVLSRWTVFPLPAFIARIAFGDMADEMLLSGVYIYPEKLEQAGFVFRYPDLESSLRHSL